jgi:hypothetical protein
MNRILISTTASVLACLMFVGVAAADVGVYGVPGEGVVISNPPGDRHSPASARHELHKLAGGLDADTDGDRSGYRIFGGSQLERDDNELIIPIMIDRSTVGFELTVDALASGKDAQPLDVFLNARKVGEVSLQGVEDAHVSTSLNIAREDGQNEDFCLLSLINAEGGRPVFIDSIRIAGARLAAPMRSFDAGGRRWILPRSVRRDGTFRLWSFGRYLKGCTERRSHDYEAFRVQRKRINRGGYRQVDAAHDTWHNLYEIKRDPDGRQVENWAEMGRRWYIGSADTSTSDQTRGFQIAFDSPADGTGTLILYATPDAPPSSLVVVVNGDRERARIGVGRPGRAGPSGWEVDEASDVQDKMDLQPGKATVYERIPIRAGRNTIDFDYAGFGFLWPAKTFEGLAELIDTISFDLTPADALPAGVDAPFREPRPAGERFDEPAQVAVDLDVRWTRRGVSAIPRRLFGVTTYSAGRTLTTTEKWAPLKHINVGGVNGGLYWGAAWPTENDGHVDDVEAYWRQEEQRIAARPEIQVLAAAHEVGIDYQMNLSTNGWGVNPLWHSGGVPTDIDAWSERIYRLARILKKFAPHVEHIYFYNENDAIVQHSHLLHESDAEKVPASQYQGMTCAAAMKKIHREFPDLKMIGPGNYGPPFGGSDGRDYVGNRFEDWVVPYLEATWDHLYAYNSHSYWLAHTREQTGEYQTLINYMHVRFGQEKPVFMDEGGLSGGDWCAWTRLDDRALWLYHGFGVLRALMSAVHTMDKRQAIFWHDYGAVAQHEWFTVRPVPAGLPPPKRPHLMNDSPGPIWTGLWLFRRLRGDTLHVEAGPGAEAAAAFDGSGYSIVVVNHALVDRDLRVSLKVPRDRTVSTAQVEFNEPGEDFYRFDAGVLPQGRWRLGNSNAGEPTLTIRARPLSGYHVRVELDQAAAPRRVAGVEESFGDKVMVELNRDHPKDAITIDCDRSVRRSAKRAWLRIAHESLLMEPEEIAFAINDAPIEVNRRDFIEIPLDPSSIRARNRLTFELKDPASRNWFRVRSATIVTEFAPR